MTRVEIDTGSVRAVPMTDEVRGIAPVGDDRAWVLTGRALIRVDATLTERARAELDPAEASTGGPLAADANSGGVWLALGQRVVNFDASGARVQEWPAAEPIRALAVAGPDAIYVATAVALTRYDASGAAIARVDLAALPGTDASGVLVDPLAGLVWLVRSGALIQFDVLAGLAPRASIAAPTPDALALEPLSGVLTTITEREIARYGRDAKLLGPTSFASEILVDLVGIAAQVDHTLLWFGDRLSVGAIDLGNGVVLRVPETDNVSRFIGSPLRLEPSLDVSTPEEVGNQADTLVVLQYGALCDGVACNASPSYLRGLRLEAYLGKRSVSSLFTREIQGEGSSGRVPVARWQNSESLRAWLTDAYGNRSDTATVTWPIVASGAGGRSVAKAGSPPTVTITAPLNNATYTAPATVTIKTTATPGTGATITKVEFFRGAALLGTVTTSPYNFTWANVQVGSYSLTARITDSLGATATSTAVAISVNAGAKATPIAAYLLNEAWASPGVVTDARGTRNGTASGTVSAVAAPAAAPKPDTCKAGSFGGGAIDVSALPVSVAAGAKTTLAFWMYWSGTDAVMPVGWVTHDLLFGAGSFGFSTLNGDVYGIASAGLANTWHHVVAEFTNGNVAADKIYLDGVLQTLTQRAGTPNNANAVVAASLRIGGLSGSASYRFGGKLDEVKVFNRALTATEVSAEFAAANACGTAPTVALTAPANNAVYVAPASIAMTATAAATGTTLTKVEFYNGATLLGTDTTTPYAYTWSNVAIGTYSLTAKAIDAKGMATKSAVVSVQIKANVAPTVALTSPANNSTFTAPATINLAATASDTDGTIAKVEFYQGATRLATVTSAPYTYAWMNVAGGNYALTAKATDDKGAVTTAAVVNVKVNKLPTVNITAPVNNAVVVLPATITINASASDPDGTISKVEFYRDGVLLGSDTTSPYSYAWTNATPGSYALTVKATDNLGAVKTSAAVTITVKLNQPPTVSITSPVNGASFVSPVPVTITATASDPDGSVATVDFYAVEAGQQYPLGTATTAPYSVTQPLGAGTNVLTAVATDNRGTATASAPVTVTVVQNQLPDITLTAPADGQVFIAPSAPPDITLAATASDADGRVVAVRFYKQAYKWAFGVNGDPDPVLLGTVTIPPYQVIWPSVPYTDQVLGTNIDSYLVWAEATDDAGEVSAAGTVIRVLPTTPRTIRITSPYNNTVFLEPATIVMSAVSDLRLGTDPVAKVDFIADGNVVGTSTSADATSSDGQLGTSSYYSSAWRNVPIGTHTLTARLTDVYGSSVTSDPVTVRAATTPTLTLQSPINAQVIPTYAGAADVPLSVAVTDPDSAISGVAYIADYRLVAWVTSAPYSATWAGAYAGAHAVWAEAYDARGNTLAATAPAYINLPLFAHPPVAVLTSPSPTGSYTTSTPVTLTAEAHAFGFAIAKVEFYNGPYLIRTLTQPPWTMTTSFSAGQQTVYAVVYVPDTPAVATTPVTFTVAGNAGTASVSLTSPSEGQQFYAPASIPLAASVSDPGGPITAVVFYAGSTLIKQVTQAPYTATWTNVGVGNYTLTAVVYASSRVTSAPVHITVAPSTTPSVTLTSPASGATYAPSQPVVMTAQATTPGHTLSRIEFTADALVLGSVTVTGSTSNATVTFTWNGAASGAHTLTAKAIATDGFNVTSTPVNVTVTDLAVALVEPFAGQTYLAPGDIRITADPSETGATIAQIDFYGDGVLLGSHTAAPYTFLWTGVAAGPHTVAVTVRDSAGLLRSSPTESVVVIGTPTIQVDSGIDGATIPDDNASVTGTIQAPLNSALIINGRLVALDRNGQFFLNGVQIQPGTNILPLVLNTQDAAPVTMTITVSSNGVAPFQVTVDPQEGLAPFATTLTIINRGSVPFQRIEIDTNDDGTPELTLTSLTNQEAEITLNYPTPGVYTVRVTVFDASNNAIYVARRKIKAVNPAELGMKVVSVYAGMVDRLAANNPTAAVKYFTGNVQAKYSSIFTALGTSLPTVASQLGTLIDGIVTEETAELTLVRDTPTGKQTFMIYLIRGGDGLWHIESM